MIERGSCFLPAGLSWTRVIMAAQRSDCIATRWRKEMCVAMATMRGETATDSRKKVASSGWAVPSNQWPTRVWDCITCVVFGSRAGVKNEFAHSLIQRDSCAGIDIGVRGGVGGFRVTCGWWG